MQKGNKQDLENLCGIDPLVKLFVDLISFDTQSDPESKTTPSTVGQLRFGAYLLATINKLGYLAKQDSNGVITVKVEATKGYEKAKSLCVLAHMDTAPDCSGANIEPSLVKNYQGGGIELENGLVINDALCKDLKKHIGEDIIVTDGTTLLGADDKAGISCILQLLHNLKVTDKIVHGPLTIIFSVDEEIGLSTKYLDVKEIGCDYGLTVDGTSEGELDIATFNAYGAIVNIKGLSVHTAVAYKTLKNAITIANEFMGLLPQDETPETTFGEEGFYHVHKIEGSTISCKLNMIIRDFTHTGMEKRLQFLDKVKDFINQKYGKDTISIKTMFQYANMQEQLDKHPKFIQMIKDAYKEAEVNVFENKVRGGTDGSNLSNQGLPTPNIFTGGLNCHGPYECLPVGAFNKAYKVLENIVQLLANTTK